MTTMRFGNGNVSKQPDLHLTHDGLVIVCVEGVYRDHPEALAKAKEHEVILPDLERLLLALSLAGPITLRQYREAWLTAARIPIPPPGEIASFDFLRWVAEIPIDFLQLLGKAFLDIWEHPPYSDGKRLVLRADRVRYHGHDLLISIHYREMSPDLWNATPTLSARPDS